MDNIEFTITWRDNEMAEFSAVVSNPSVTANVSFYIQKHIIEQLALQNSQKDILERRYDFGCHNLLLSAARLDRLGHVILNAEINNFEELPCEHTLKCSTVIQTDIGCLERFFEAMPSFYDKDIGSKLVLNPY